MAAKPPKAASPLEIAEQWALVLKHALEHPTLDDEGRVCFKTRLRLPKGGDPVSKCPTPGRDVFYCQHLVEIANCLRRLIHEGR